MVNIQLQCISFFRNLTTCTAQTNDTQMTFEAKGARQQAQITTYICMKENVYSVVS